MTRLWLLGGVLFGLTVAGLSLHVPGALGIGSIRLKTWFVVIAGISAAVYLLAVLLVTHRPTGGRAVWVVLLVAAALRLVVLPAPPFLSTDVYRYVWDGRVQAAGINPYLYLPVDPALRSLRDDFVFPRISRAEYAPTIYPPAAQMVFAAVGLVWSSVTGVKAAMVGFEVLAVFCLL
jgi:alpha-1,6-mannosyltransferase